MWTPCWASCLSSAWYFVMRCWIPACTPTMRYNKRAVALAGTLAAASGSILAEAFVATPAAFHTVVKYNNDSNKLRFAANRQISFPTPNTGLVGRAQRQQYLLVINTVVIPESCPLRSAPLMAARGTSGVSAAVRRHPRVRKPPGTAVRCSMSSDDGSNDNGGVLNPLNREDPERARLNTLITILAETPMENWKPAVLDEFMSSLLKGGLYRQAMADRLAKVRSGEEQQALTRVDAFLSGYLSQERRRASRKKVSIILSAATEGPMELDDCVRILGNEDLLDDDLTAYIASLVTTEQNKGAQSTLLKVLKTVRDRVQAELKTGTRPEVRTLAQAMTMDDSAERSTFIQHAFTKIEDLDEFVKFVQEGVEYMGNEFRFAVQTNMPPENYDKMKAIYAEAAAIRRSYLR